MILGWNDVDPVPIADGPPTPHHLNARRNWLKEHLPDGFEVDVAGPFVVVFEGSPQDARAHAQLVEEAATTLRVDLFGRDPDKMIDVWLFANTRRYRNGIRDLLADWPRTLSGYYSPKRRAVVVNLSAGLHTLRHEIVHPYMATSHPDVPAWVDEGVAALFEHTHHDDEGLKVDAGRRLRRLQRAILRRKLPSLAALTAGTPADFYQDPSHLSYAQARYAMMWLHRRNALTMFLALLTDPERADPTGFNTFMSVLGTENAEQAQREWEDFVLSLGDGSAGASRSTATSSTN